MNLKNRFTKSLAFIVGLVALAVSCTYSTLNDPTDGADFRILYGTVCGWCTVNDTLTIDSETVRYVNYANCSTAKSAFLKTGQLTKQEYNELVALLDFDEFRKINLNSCNVCVDGCDDWIRVEKGTESHYIRFSREDSKLKPIRKFIDQLNLVKEKYSR